MSPPSHRDVYTCGTSTHCYGPDIPIAQKTPPRPSPDPIFVLHVPQDKSVTSILFLAPALKLENLSKEKLKFLADEYGITPECVLSPLLKLPPADCLPPTTHLAAGQNNGEINIWNLRVSLIIFSFISNR